MSGSKRPSSSRGFRGAPRHSAGGVPKQGLRRAIVVVSLSSLLGVFATTSMTAALWNGQFGMTVQHQAQAGVFYSVERLDVAGSADVSTGFPDPAGITLKTSDVEAMLAAPGQKITIPIKVTGRLDPKYLALRSTLTQAALPQGTVLGASTFDFVQVAPSGTPDAQMCATAPPTTYNPVVVAANQGVRTAAQYLCLTITYTPNASATNAQNGRLDSKVDVQVKHRIDASTLGDAATDDDDWHGFVQGDVSLLWWTHSSV